MKHFLLIALLFTISSSFAQATGNLPVPPPGAIVFNQINQMSGWSSCHDPGCAGGSGSGSYWMAQYQSQPSLSGASAEIFNSGVWANALWWKKLGGHDGTTNLLWISTFSWTRTPPPRLKPWNTMPSSSWADTTT